MSKEDDLLFCKIAIQTGLVTQEDAKICLGLAQRIENDGRARPRIGSIFVKRNILTQQNVQRINQAVQKRRGSQGQSSGRGRGARSGATAGGRVAARARGRRSGRAAPAETDGRRKSLPKHSHPGGGSRKKVSQSALWIYVCSGVVFVGLLISMAVIAIKSATTDNTQEQQRSGDTRQDRVKTLDDVVGNLGGTGGGEQDPKKHSTDSEFYKTFSADHKQNLDDARRSMMMDDLYGRAITQLSKFKQEHATQYGMFAALGDEMDARITQYEQKVSSEFEEIKTEALKLKEEGKKSEADDVVDTFKEKVGGLVSILEKIDELKRQIVE